MITIKSEHEIELMRQAGLMVSKTHKYLKQYLKPGITTKELDKLAEDYIRSMGGVPTCKGYEGFPATLCTSINDEVVHGIPSNRKLKNGDIITIDMVIGYHGYQGDAAWTYAIGDISEDKKNLMKYTKEALYEGVKEVKPGARIGDISNAVEKYATKHNLGIVKELVGHGIGTEMHEDPQIPNFRQKRKGMKLQAGMTLAIEPMINIGRPDVAWTDDDWTVVTDDGSLSAHYENTILITKGEPEILSL